MTKELLARRVKELSGPEGQPVAFGRDLAASLGLPAGVAFEPGSLVSYLMGYRPAPQQVEVIAGLIIELEV